MLCAYTLQIVVPFLEYYLLSLWDASLPLVSFLALRSVLSEVYRAIPASFWLVSTQWVFFYLSTYLSSCAFYVKWVSMSINMQLALVFWFTLTLSKGTFTPSMSCWLLIYFDLYLLYLSQFSILFPNLCFCLFLPLHFAFYRFICVTLFLQCWGSHSSLLHARKVFYHWATPLVLPFVIWEYWAVSFSLLF